MRAKLIGFQIADTNGALLTGEENDPTNMTTFEVLSPLAAIEAVKELGAMGRYLLMPIYENDIEDPEVIHKVWRVK